MSSRKDKCKKHDREYDSLKVKDLCVKNVNAVNIHTKNTIKLPIINVAKSNPSISDLAVDKNTGNLYFSDGKNWYLTQSSRKVVNATINPQGTGDYQSLNSFFDLFEGSPTGFGTVNLQLEPGEYSLDRSNILFRPEQLNLIGDTRNIAGMSYINGKRANMNNRPLLGTPGSNTQLLFDNNIVTINVDNLDLTQVSLVPGDKVYIFSAVSVADRPTPPGPRPALEVYTIQSIESNKINLTEQLSEKILTAYQDGAISPSITFCPNRKVTSKSDFIYNVSLNANGIWFESDNITFQNKLETENCLIKSSLISNKNLNLTNSTQIVPVSEIECCYGLISKINTILEGTYIISERVGAIHSIDSDVIFKTSTFLTYQNPTQGGGTGMLRLENCKSDDFEKLDQGFIRVKGGFLVEDTMGAFFYLDSSNIEKCLDIECENVANIAVVTNISKFSITKVHTKMTVELDNFGSGVGPLWLSDKFSELNIHNDTYTFDYFRFNIYEALRGSIINIGTFSTIHTNYSTYPPGTSFAYKADGSGSKIVVRVQPAYKWPGPIIETDGGVVEFGPTADFTFAPLTGPAPLEVHFTNLSTGTPAVTQNNWNFGDGNESGDVNPVHTYATSGTYTIKLTVFNSIGSTQTSKQIIVL